MRDKFISLWHYLKPVSSLHTWESSVELSRGLLLAYTYSLGQFKTPWGRWTFISLRKLVSRSQLPYEHFSKMIFPFPTLWEKKIFLQSISDLLMVHTQGESSQKWMKSYFLLTKSLIDCLTVKKWLCQLDVTHISHWNEMS